MGVLNGIVTLIAMVTFVGIVWWAWSRGRERANKDASMLPFALPDEDEQGGEQDSTPKDKKQGDSHE